MVNLPISAYKQFSESNLSLYFLPDGKNAAPLARATSPGGLKITKF